MAVTLKCKYMNYSKKMQKMFQKLKKNESPPSSLRPRSDPSPTKNR